MPKLIPQFPREYFRVGVSCFFMTQGTVFGSWAARIPDIQLALNLNDAELGTALFAAPLGQIPAMLMAGFVVGRFGSRKVLVCALLLYISAFIGLSIASSLGWLFASLMLFGASGNFVSNAVNTQAVGVEKLYKRSIMASFHGLWSTGGIIGGVIATAFASFHIIPLYHFMFIAVLLLLALLLLFSWTLPHDSFKRVQPGTNKKFVTPDAMLLILGFIAFSSMATEGVLYNWSSVYYTKVLEVGQKLTRLGYIAAMCMMVSGRFLADFMINRFGQVRVLQASGLLMSGGLALMVACPQLIPATIGAAMAGFGMAAGVPICYSLAGKSQKFPPALAISMVATVSFFGFLICPPLIGHLSHAYNLRFALAPMACLGISMTLLAPLIKRYRK